MDEPIPRIPEENIDRGIENINSLKFSSDLKGIEDSFQENIKNADVRAIQIFMDAQTELASSTVESISSSTDQQVGKDEAKTYFDAIDISSSDPSDIIYSAKNFQITNSTTFNKLTAILKGLGARVTTRFKTEIPDEVQQSAKALAQAVDDAAAAPTDSAAQFNLTLKIAQHEANVDGMDTVNDRVLEKTGSSTWKGAFKVVMVLGLIGGGVGIWFFLKHVADALTGCYKYTVDDDGHIQDDGPLACPAKGDITHCTCIDCNGAQTEYAPCCNKVPCQGRAGATPSLYYAYKKVTPASLLNDAIKAFLDLAKTFAEGTSKIFKTILTALAVIGIMTAVGIIVFIVFKLVHK